VAISRIYYCPHSVADACECRKPARGLLLRALREFGIAAERCFRKCLVLNRASMLIDAAVDGQGIALARTALAAWDLINGRLVRPVDVSLKMSNTYWIVCPKATSGVPKIATFRKWLLVEAAEDARRLKELSLR